MWRLRRQRRRHHGIGSTQGRARDTRGSHSAYAEDFPEEYFWATGAQAPALLYNLMSQIEMATTGDVLGPWQQKGRVVHLITRKPEGNA